MAGHNTLTGAELHEPKGMSSATGGASDVGKVAASDGAGATVVRKLKLDELDATGVTAGKILVSDGTMLNAQLPCRMGMWDYNDLATQTTPLALSTAGTFFNLPNDGLGPFTLLTFALPELTNIWNVSTNRFDYSNLTLGDTVDIRVDIEVTTTGANHEIVLAWEFGLGGSPYQLQIIRQNFKTAGTFTFTVLHSAYMGDANTRDNPSVLKVQSDTGTTDTVKVNGWFVRTVTRSDF